MLKTIQQATKNRYLSIRWKLVLPLAATIIVLISVLSPVTNIFVNTQIEGESDRRLGEIAGSVSALIENSEYLARTNAALLANQPEVIQAFSDLSGASPLLVKDKESLRLQEISLYLPNHDSNDSAYYYGGPQVARRLQVSETTQVIRDELIQRALKEKISISSVAIAPQSSQILGVSPVLDPQTKKVLGVVLVSFYMDQDYIDNLSKIINTDLAIVKDNKVVVTNIDNAATYEMLINEGWLKNSDQPTSNIQYSDGQEYRILGRSLVISGRDQGVTVIVSQPIEQLNAVSRNIQIIIFMLIGVFTLMAIWFWIAAFVTFTRPLEQLTKATTHISLGEFNHNVSTSAVFMKDEITVLSENFNAMTFHLNELYASLEERVEQRTQELVEERNKLSVALDNLERALQGLAEARDEAVMANKSKSEFVSVVSHELKIPMTSIKGYSDLMLAGATGALNENQVNFLKTIRGNVNRMATLVSDLSDISRIESGNLRLEPSEVDIKEIIEEVTALSQNQLELKQQTIKLNFPPDLPKAWGDRNRLAQIMTNLISNANKYTPDKGAVQVNVQTIIQTNEDDSKKFIKIDVIDNGLGMSPEDQAQLFNKFFRSADEKVREAPGTGLGLSITKNLIELQGGEISFTSKFRKGTTFTFTIPTAETQQPA